MIGYYTKIRNISYSAAREIIGYDSLEVNTFDPFTVRRKRGGDGYLGLIFHCKIQLTLFQSTLGLRGLNRYRLENTFLMTSCSVDKSASLHCTNDNLQRN